MRKPGRVGLLPYHGHLRINDSARVEKKDPCINSPTHYKLEGDPARYVKEGGETSPDYWY